jgi:hypothetical protein
MRIRDGFSKSESLQKKSAAPGLTEAADELQQRCD